MYLAEIRGKLSRENENREDILTSNVFSFFKYASRVDFLYPFIRSLGLDISSKDAVEAEFLFWPTYEDGTEPDVVMVVGKYYLLFEAKYLSGFGKETPTIKNQLSREIIGGAIEAENLLKEFHLFALTADHFEKPELKKDVPVQYRAHYSWINWQRIAYFIYRILELSPDLCVETREFATDLYSLFLKKNLRGYEGTKILGEIRKLSETKQEIFFDAGSASFRGDFIGFEEPFQSSVPVEKIQREIFFVAASAKYRGDFIGFDQILIGDHPIKPSIVFFKIPIMELFQFGNGIVFMEMVPDTLFFLKE